MSLNQTDYSDAWADCRRRVWLPWIVFLSYLPGMVLISGLAEYFRPDLTDEAVAAGFFVWATALLASVIFRHSFRCPRCSKRFFRSYGWHAHFGRSCWNCGLRKGEHADVQTP